MHKRTLNLQKPSFLNYHLFGHKERINTNCVMGIQFDRLFRFNFVNRNWRQFLDWEPKISKSVTCTTQINTRQRERKMITLGSFMEALRCMKTEFLVCPERTVCFSQRFKTSTSVKPLRLLILSSSSGDTFHEPLSALLLSRCVEFAIKKQVLLHVVSLSRQRLLIHSSACPCRSVYSEAAHMNVPQKTAE